MTNPFEVLRLDPTASEEDVVRQAERLRQRTTDEAARGVIRQAAKALTGNAEERQLQALLTHPRPAGESKELDRFVAAFRRAPAETALDEPCPAIEELDPAAAAATAAEAERQRAEALWQSLLFDPRA